MPFKAAAEEHGVDLTGMEILDIGDPAVLLELRDTAERLFPDMSSKRIDRRLQNPLSIASLLVAADRAGGMVAGLRHTTQEVVVAAAGFIPLREGVAKPTSMFLMRIPGYEGPQGETLVFADCGVVISPDARRAGGDSHPDRRPGPDAVRLGATRGHALLLHQGERLR